MDIKYSINDAVDYILDRGYTRVALQFPDEMCFLSVQIALEMEMKLKESFVFVLGDTSYGSCCVDEVAAQHLKAEIVVHFGKACLSPTSVLPVYYVFGDRQIHETDVVDKLRIEMEKCKSHRQIVLLYELEYGKCMKGILNRLKYDFKQMILGTIIDRYDPSDTTKLEGEDNDVHSAEQDCDVVKLGGLRVDGLEYGIDNETMILFVGKEASKQWTNILLRCNSSTCIRVDPDSGFSGVDTKYVNRQLMRRYYLVQQAKDAEIFGIVVGTLAVKSYLHVIQTVKELIARSGRKSYLFVVGKLNVAKMANFAEIDVFVLVACAENSMLDCKEFYKPIVTPFELSIALSPQTDAWTGEYKMDFQEYLPALLKQASVQDVDTEPHFSLITGNYRQSPSVTDQLEKKQVDDASTENTALSTRSKENAITLAYESPAASILQSRSFQGLEPKIGESAPHAALPGSSGIASNYIRGSK